MALTSPEIEPVAAARATPIRLVMSPAYPQFELLIQG
jgi:hypothetical protein